MSNRTGRVPRSSAKRVVAVANEELLERDLPQGPREPRREERAESLESPRPAPPPKPKSPTEEKSA